MKIRGMVGLLTMVVFLALASGGLAQQQRGFSGMATSGPS